MGLLNGGFCMFNIGDKVVYPMHGAGIIESIEEKEILGNKQKYYIRANCDVSKTSKGNG
jgi:CarD family transcriptional regulator